MKKSSSHKFKKPSSRQHGQIAQSHLVVFRIVLTLLPVLLLSLAEIVLRLFDYGGALDLFLQSEKNGQIYFTTNKRVGEKYFSGGNVAVPDPYDEFFPAAKAANTLRLFCLGASTTVGFPYDFNATFPALLKDRLQAAFPEKNFEVINLGIPAVMSHTVLDFVKQVLPHEPDLLIIYMGQNEFYGALGAGSSVRIGGNRRVVQIYLWLQNFRLFRLLQNMINGLRAKLRSASAPEPDRRRSLMEALAQNRAIPLGSPVYQNAVATFRENLRDIIRLCRRQNVPLVISTLVTNLKDQPPFISVFAETTTEERKQQWEKLFLAADSARRSNNLPLASDRLAAAAAIDSMPAKLYFAMGQCLEGREDYSAAHRAYSRARDLDGLRFRASGDLNAVIRSFAKEPGVFIADNESTFAAASPDGIVGNNLLFEHVHPLAQGYFLIAKTFGETMRDSALIFSPPEWANHPWPGDDSLWALAAVTPLDEKMAEFRIAVLKSGWPFRESRGELPSFHPQDEMERLASEVAMRRLDWRNAHLQYGEILARANNLAAATPEFYAVAKVTPENEWPWMRLGDLYGLQENYAQAERAYRQALAIRPTAAIELKLGSLYLTMDNSQAAVAPLERAINATAPALAPGELAVAHYFLAAALANCGQLQRALQEIALAGQLAPDNPDIKLLQKQLEE